MVLGGSGGSSSIPCGEERDAVGRAVPLAALSWAASRTEGQPTSPTRAAGWLIVWYMPSSAPLDITPGRTPPVWSEMSNAAGEVLAPSCTKWQCAPKWHMPCCWNIEQTIRLPLARWVGGEAPREPSANSLAPPSPGKSP